VSSLCPSSLFVMEHCRGTLLRRDPSDARRPPKISSLTRRFAGLFLRQMHTIANTDVSGLQAPSAPTFTTWRTAFPSPCFEDALNDGVAAGTDFPR